jgi:Protein of unknown function (DUF3592)
LSENADSSTGLRDRWITGLFGAVFTLIGLGFAVGTAVDWRRESAVHASGTTRAATVISKQVITDEGKHYYVRYTLEAPAGVRHITRRKVAKRLWRSIVIGDTLPVRYDPAAPQHSRLVAEGPPNVMFAIGMSLFSGLFALFGAVLAIAAIQAEVPPPQPPTRRPRQTLTRSGRARARVDSDR